MSVYYNEIDERAAAWLRALMKARVIPDGEIDTRSIVDVRAGELRDFRQCHFFAGIGGWAYALSLAGWGDRPVWTGSCPCQPWSVAGKGEGADDPRHLWPAWFGLIEERRPAVIFGEQTASKDGEYWLDLVQANVEAADYAFGPVVLPACSVGTPHRRNRLWFVADTDVAPAVQRPIQRDHGLGQRAEDEGSLHLADANRRRQRADRPTETSRGARARKPYADERGETGGVGDAGNGRRGRRKDQRQSEDTPAIRTPETDHARGSNELGDAFGAGLQGHAGHVDDGDQPGWFGTVPAGSATTAGPTSGFWRDAEWIACSDGKARPVEPGTFPLAYGIPARVGRLRGYGNAIVPQVAAEVIAAYMEVRGMEAL